MKLVDWYFFPRFEAMSEEEYDAYQEKKLAGRCNKVIQSISDYQIKKERAVKLKSMRAYLYGKFIVRIPRVSLDLYRDIPLPRSSANLFQRRTSDPIIVSERKFGQDLKGDMIPVRDIQAKSDSELSDSKIGARIFSPRHLIQDIPRRVDERTKLLGNALHQDLKGEMVQKQSDSEFSNSGIGARVFGPNSEIEARGFGPGHLIQGIPRQVGERTRLLGNKLRRNKNKSSSEDENDTTADTCSNNDHAD